MVNEAENSLNPPVKQSVSFLEAVVPSTFFGKVVLWCALPLLSLLLNTSCAYVCFEGSPLYFTAAVLIGVPLVIRYRLIGLLILFVAVGLMWLPQCRTHSLPQAGAFFALLVNGYILLLAIEEVESLLNQSLDKGAQSVELKKKLNATILELAEARERHHKEHSELMEQLAESEKHFATEKKRIVLVDQENYRMSELKGTLIEELREAKEVAARHLLSEQEQQSVQERVTAALDENERLKKENSHLERSYFSTKEDMVSAQKLVEEAEVQAAELRSQVEELSRLSGEQIKVEAEAAELRSQVEELSTQLSEQVKVEAETVELRNRIEELESARGEKEVLKAHLAEVEQELEESALLKARIEALSAELEERTSTTKSLQKELEETAFLKSDLAAERETRKQLEEQLDAPVADMITSEEMMEMKREIARKEGLNKQLRSQFEDKSRILAQTRKELFAEQGKRLVVEKEQALSASEPMPEELDLLEQALRTLATDYEEMEQMLYLQEELINTLLSTA